MLYTPDGDIHLMLNLGGNKHRCRVGCDVFCPMMPVISDGLVVGLFILSPFLNVQVPLLDSAKV